MVGEDGLNGRPYFKECVGMSPKKKGCSVGNERGELLQ